MQEVEGMQEAGLAEGRVGNAASVRPVAKIRLPGGLDRSGEVLE